MLSASFQPTCESHNEPKSPATKCWKKMESNINDLLPRHRAIRIKTKRLQDPSLVKKIKNRDGLWEWDSFLGTDPKSRLQD